MNEQLAKKKLCPFSLNNPNDRINLNCVVKGCMAWQGTNVDEGICKLIDKPKQKGE